MTDSKYRFTHPICYCIVIAVCVFGVRGEERTATEWVQAMHEAQAKRSFEGILDYWNGSDIISIEYSQYVIDGKVKVKAKPIKGPKREINRTDEGLSISFSPDDELRGSSNELSGDSLSRLITPDVATLSESYDIDELSDRIIADRTAVGISIMPKQADRHGFKIWIDKSTALMLRMEMCDCDDAQQLKMLQFTEIRVLEGLDPALANADDSDESDLSVSIVNTDESDESNIQAGWEPNYIPDGFKLSATKTKEGVLFHRKYSDGMNSFTVQIRPLPGNKKVDNIQLETMVGPTIIASRNASGSRGRPQIIIVVGDLPRRTIWKISEGVKFER